MTDAKTHFSEIAPPFMQMLLEDFPQLSKLDAAAVFGNLGHESAGFTKLQEMKPTIPGSRGGYGWAQWTGSRRREYEAYCQRNGKDPAAPESNYAFLFLELRGSERAAIQALKSASTLYQKVEAFERSYERAGVKHYPSRNQWALIALEAYENWLAEGGNGEVIPDAPQLPDANPDASLPDMATIEAVTQLASMPTEQLKALQKAFALALAIQDGWTVQAPNASPIPATRTPGITFQPMENEPMDTKSFFKSKTLIGIALAALPVIFPQAAPFVLPLQDLAGVDPQATAAVTEVVNSGVQLIGLILAAFGRFSATTKLTK
jgi:hypothetical protein